MIDIRKTVFLVDGQSEIKAFNSKFLSTYGLKPNLRKVDCNGKDVTPEGYVNKAYGILHAALRSYFTYIICILDREKRRMKASRLAHKVKLEIIKKTISSTKFREQELKDKIHVFVPDIMFENWIVSDIIGIMNESNLFKNKIRQEYFDGTSGVTVLKKSMIIPYRKTSHCSLLFNLSRFDISHNNSPSFKAFYDMIISPQRS